MAEMQFHSDASYVSARERAGQKPRTNSIQPKRGKIEKPTSGMRFSPEASSVHRAGVEERENRQPEVFQEHVTSQEPAVKMGSMAVIKQQRVGGRKLQENVDLEGGVEDEKLCEKGEEKELTSAASPPEEQQEGIGKTALPEGSHELSGQSDLPMQGREGNVTGGLILTYDLDNRDFTTGNDIITKHAEMNAVDVPLGKGVDDQKVWVQEKATEIILTEEQPEGMCKTIVSEESPELFEEWDREAKQLTSLPGSDLQQEPEVSEKLLTGDRVDARADALHCSSLLSSDEFKWEQQKCPDLAACREQVPTDNPAQLTIGNSVRFFWEEGVPYRELLEKGSLGENEVIKQLVIPKKFQRGGSGVQLIKAPIWGHLGLQ
uniref:Uncharacterized protein n=1 Tax=Sphaerodactylus townsendi TaxID=933632 RepID=A0ACB8FGB9_9SAUR